MRGIEDKSGSNAFVKDIDLIRELLREVLRTELKEVVDKCEVELVTRKEAARLLRVDVSTIHNWTKQDLIKAYGIKHRVYYKKTELISALKELN